MRADEIVKACNAKLLKGDLGFETTISTDTRTIKSGEIYLPLKGENFDGENFIEDALNSGAIGYFTTKDIVFDNAKLVFNVENTLTAYMQLAGFYREKINPKVVAITGSSGKTTTKEMVYSVLKENFKTVKTLANHNNEIGFCQTVFSTDFDTQILIVEAGMRGLGEIEFICKYAKPDISIITNIGNAHIGRLGSVENIAKAKCEIIKYLNKNGTLIALNQDITKQCVNFDGEKIYFSMDDVKIVDRKIGYTKFLYKAKEYELQVEGDYNVLNSLVAIETGYKLGMEYSDIKKGLYSYKPIEKRWEIQNISGFTIINDSYNANPESMKASVKTFVQLYKNPVVILGDMGELGEKEVELHAQVGECFKDMKNVKFLTVGNLAGEISKVLEQCGIWTKNFQDKLSVSRYILDNLDISNTIFLKASRSMKFEEIIENIKRGSL